VLNHNSIISTSLFFAFTILFHTFGYPQAPLPERIEQTIDNAAISKNAFVGVLVVDLDSGEELYARFPDKLFTPASNGKIYSSAAALDIFGPDHQFETYIGMSGRIDNGRLDGNLYLIGRGDPTMKTDDLKSLAKQVTDYGIREVSGDLVVDVSLFNDTLKGPGWMWDDNPSNYSMSISALMLNYNVATAQVQRMNSGDLIPSFIPSSDYPPFVWQENSQGSIRISRDPFRSEFIVSGNQMPENRSRVSRSLAVYDPPLWIGHTFKKMLQSNGLEFVSGYQNSESANPISEVRVAPSPESTEIIIRQPSLPMRDILPLFNKPSENAIGEMLWHHLALSEGAYPASWSAGRTAMYNWLANKVGLPQGSVRLEDGSGLSRYNLITPRTTVKVLDYMWKSDNRQVYLDSLPVIGVDGTLSGRGNSNDIANNIIAKTGTMSGVSTLSGYAKDLDGNWKLFSILVNGYVGSSSPARNLQDQICAQIIIPDSKPDEPVREKPKATQSSSVQEITP